MKEGDTEIIIELIKHEHTNMFIGAYFDTGWSWRHVRVWPATLDRLEKEGYLQTKLRSESYHGYVVTDLAKQVVGNKHAEMPDFHAKLENFYQGFVCGVRVHYDHCHKCEHFTVRSGWGEYCKASEDFARELSGLLKSEGVLK